MFIRLNPTHLNSFASYRKRCLMTLAKECLRMLGKATTVHYLPMGRLARGKPIPHLDTTRTKVERIILFVLVRGII